MTSSIVIDTTVLEQRLARIGSLGDASVYRQIGLVAARKAGVAAERPAREYPPKRNPLSKYRRTGRLGSSITSAPFALQSVVGFWIGTNVSYGPYVIGSHDQQARIHRDWWTPLIDGLIAEKPTITRVYEQAYIEEVNRYVNQ